MLTVKRLFLILLSVATIAIAEAQDPSFSQFFSSPLNVNPALTGRINAKWRMISNIRDQWIGPASPYTTGTVSYDTKILKDRIPDNNVLGIGGMMMYDQAMRGVLKSIYASLNSSYTVQIAAEGGDHRIGIGVGAIYGSKHIDFSRLNFPEQFNGYGFDTNLPTGEAALINMKPYFSTSVGGLYSYTTEYANLDIGFSVFHFNRPKQTVLQDEKQYLPKRYVAHSNFETFLNDRLVLNANAIYQNQAQTSYASVGGALGYYLTEQGQDDVVVYGGMWYWSKNAVIPYAGLLYKGIQFGITYDVTVSKLSQASIKPKTWELCIILRGYDRDTRIMWCPWK